MEKRALLAVLLSVGVVVIWYSLFPPAPPQMVGVEQARAAGPEGSEAEEKPRGAEPKQRVEAEAEERVVLGGEGFWVEVSNRGGVVLSWKLAGYRDREGQQQELLPKGGGLLSLAESGPWNEGLYRVERREKGVRLEWADGQGRWVEKELAVDGRFGLRVRVRTLGFGGPVRLVVSRGLATWGGEKVSGSLGRADFVGLAEKLQRVTWGKEERVAIGPKAAFVGAEDQYFLLALLPDGPGSGWLDGKEGVAVVEAPGEVAGLLLGLPKEHKLLKSFNRGLEKTLSFGLFGFFSLIFLEVLRWIHGWSGNWGVGIIVLTALIRLLLFPLTHKSTVAMRRMGKLQPKIKAIQERYQERVKKDPSVRARMNQEIMELYRREGVNPMGGCLPMLVQIPILWALYTLFAFAIELRHQPFVLWIKDLSAKDPTYITPILMTASMVLQQRLAPQTGDPAQRRLFMIMPFIFGLMFMNFPSGLVLYWLVNNLLTIGQQLLTEKLLQRDGGAV